MGRTTGSGSGKRAAQGGGAQGEEEVLWEQHFPHHQRSRSESFTFSRNLFIVVSHGGGHLLGAILRMYKQITFGAIGGQ